MGLDITILIAIGSLLIGFITGLIINFENRDERYVKGYEDGYADGYKDISAKNNPTEKIKNTKYNTRY